MTDYQDVFYQSDDGLNLYARDYVNDDAEFTLLCMHGLTRNSADFDELCERMHPDYRLIAVDQRGRGRSDYDPIPANYHPARYVTDMFTLIDTLNLTHLVLIGTSLGGLMAMLMAAMKPEILRGVILNDIGPEVDPAGLARIQSYAGKSASVSNWQEAAAQAAKTNGVAFPDYGEADWLAFAEKVYRENDEGIPVLAYDPAIAKPIDADPSNAVPPNLWPVFDALKPIPTLLIHGEISDILAPSCIAEMKQHKPDLEVVGVPNRGHAPTLNEPIAAEAIARWCEKLAR